MYYKDENELHGTGISSIKLQWSSTVHLFLSSTLLENDKAKFKNFRRFFD